MGHCGSLSVLLIRDIVNSFWRFLSDYFQKLLSMGLFNELKICKMEIITMKNNQIPWIIFTLKLI